MSQYLKKKASNCHVTHEFSGKRHFYKVKGETGNYNVSFNFGCDCRYHSVQGVANRKVCSHVLAVMESIVKTAKLDMNYGKECYPEIKRSECLQLVRQSNRHVGKIRFSDGEGKAHIKKKEELCKSLNRDNKLFITEAIIDKAGLRVDVLVLDDFLAIEIVDSETKESIENKRKKLESVGLNLKVVEVDRTSRR